MATPTAGEPSGDLRVHLGVSLGGLELRNPIMPASGCFGPELAPFIDLNTLGALVTKTVFASERTGNPPHRVAETPSGMLNSVGIPSPGIKGFTERIWPAYRRWHAPTIVSVGGLSIEDFFNAAAGVAPLAPDALEVNVSCPNLEEGGVELGSQPENVYQVIAGIKERVSMPVIAKLTPNVTSIEEIAIASEEAGADALTVCNTIVGLAVDAKERKTVLGRGQGGLSGPAIKPIALHLCAQAYRSVSIPVIGCGGISSAEDVVEFLEVGATAVQVGTANFGRPVVMAEILDVLPGLLSSYGFGSVKEAVGVITVD